MLVTLKSGRALDLTITEHLTVERVVARLHTWYAIDGNQFVLTALIRRAERVDQPLCSAARCWTPHNLTHRSCCGDFVCDDHEPDHDRCCAEFEAQLREETL